MSAEMLQDLNLPRKQPPSGRDREIYEFVMHIGASQETAAKRWGISQARVSQIVQRVEDWMHTVLGEAEGELPPNAMSDDPPLSPAERLQLAEQIAYERMEFVYGESLRAWRKSQEDSCQRRERADRPRSARVALRRVPGYSRWESHSAGSSPSSKFRLS